MHDATGERSDLISSPRRPSDAESMKLTTIRHLNLNLNSWLHLRCGGGARAFA